MILQKGQLFKSELIDSRGTDRTIGATITLICLSQILDACGSIDCISFLKIVEYIHRHAVGCP